MKDSTIQINCPFNWRVMRDNFSAVMVHRTIKKLLAPPPFNQSAYSTSHGGSVRLIVVNLCILISILSPTKNHPNFLFSSSQLTTIH